MTLKPNLVACHQTPCVQKKIPMLTLQPGVCSSNTVPRETNGERVSFSLEDDFSLVLEDTELGSKDEMEGSPHTQALFKQNHDRSICVQGNRGLDNAGAEGAAAFICTDEWSGDCAVSKGQSQETWDELGTHCGRSRPKLESKCGNDYV